MYRVYNAFVPQNVRKVNHMSFSCTLINVTSFAEGVIAGGTAGVVVETALYPIDTIKTRLQVG